MPYDYEAARRYWRSSKGKIARKRYSRSKKGKRALRRQRIRARLRTLERISGAKRETMAALERKLRELEKAV